MKLRLGYVPLTDAVALIAAAELGFAAREGLEIELVREPSWATLRDRLALGYLDGAHILAPLALAMNDGLSGKETPLVAPFALNLDGNAVTVSTALWAQMRDSSLLDTLEAIAGALVCAIRNRHRSGRSFTLATVFPFSSHTIQLQTLLALGGLDRSEFPTIVTVPPPQMVESLGSGVIDAFCCGSPWNSVAVEAGVGCIAAPSCAITPECPEKLLALPAAAAETAELGALVRALKRAADWCADVGNHAEAAALLAKPEHLDVAAPIIFRTLSGALIVTPHGATLNEPRFFVTGGESARPRAAHAEWLQAQFGMAARRRAPVYRPDLYERAFR